MALSSLDLRIWFLRGQQQQGATGKSPVHHIANVIIAFSHQPKFLYENSRWICAKILLLLTLRTNIEKVCCYTTTKEPVV